jgi:hypothetical protein
LKDIIQKLNINLELIFFLLLIFGLPFSIFIKELNYLFFDFFDFKIIYFYRSLIFLLSIIIFYKMKKNFNIWVFFIFLINILFLFNVFNGDLISFKTDSWNYFVELNYFFEEQTENNILYSQKNKFIIINLLNITLPLFVLSFMKTIGMEISKFKITSKILCEIFTICLFILIVFKFLENFLSYTEIENLKINFINPHMMLYILNINFLLILDKYFNQLNKLNNRDYLILILIFLSFIITESMLHILICFLTLISFLIIKQKINLNICLIIFSFLLLILITFGLNYILSGSNFNVPATFLGSLDIRIYTLKYFLNETNNLNFFIGNNIFSKTLVTYPHNIFFDLVICTGILGLTIFFYINIKLLIYLIRKKSAEILFFYFIFFQSLIFSNFSGFFFVNIILNITLAVSFILSKSKDDKITKNSFG